MPPMEIVPDLDEPEFRPPSSVQEDRRSCPAGRERSNGPGEVKDEQIQVFSRTARKKAIVCGARQTEAPEKGCT